MKWKAIWTGKEIILVRGVFTTDWKPVVFIGNGLVSQCWGFQVNIKYYTVDETTEEWFTMILTSEFCWPGPRRWLDVKAHHSQELQGHFPWGCTSSHCMIEANHVKADGVAWRPDQKDWLAFQRMSCWRYLYGKNLLRDGHSRHWVGSMLRWHPCPRVGYRVSL